MKTILIMLSPDLISESQFSEIQSLAPDKAILFTEDRGEIEANAEAIEIAVGWVPRDLLCKFTNLRWFQQWGAGADWLLDHPGLVESNFTLTNTSGLHAIPISEHILSFMLAMARDLKRSVIAQEQRHWLHHESKMVIELAGKTLLLVGVGAIGERTAQVASALGMRVLGVRRDPARQSLRVERMYGPAQLAEVLPQADFVVLTVPLTRETKGMIGRSALKAMKPSAYIINIGRGGTIQETHLLQALQEGWIAGAGLDVFEDEPLPSDSPFWELENVIITSHYSGKTPHYTERGLAIFTENLRRYQAGDPLHNVVDKKLGY